MVAPEPSNRIGRFDIPFDIISRQPETVLRMLVGKLVVRAEARYEVAAIEYHAYCDDFNEVGRGQQIPEYIAEFNHEDVAQDNPVIGESVGGSIKVIEVFQGWVRKK